MALVLKDRVKETTTTSGTGAITLSGAVAGFDSFSVIGDGNTSYYAIVAQTPGEWEVGIGTYTASGTTLARTTVLANSAGTQPSALSFSAGNKDVFVTYPAATAVVASDNPGTSGQVLTSNGSGVAPTWTDPYSAALTIDTKTAAYTVISSDLGKVINFGSIPFTVTASLTSAATLGAGFTCWIWNSSPTAANNVIIDPNGTETIDGFSTLYLRPSEGVQIISNGTNWITGGATELHGYAENIDLTTALPVAEGISSIAISPASVATGYYSIAAGYASQATGNNSSAFGNDAIASGTNATAIGNGSRATTNYSVSVGGSGYPVKISDSYKLPTTAGTSGQVVTTDGTGQWSYTTKQDTLVSGTNIKTVNSSSLLGSGDIPLFAGGLVKIEKVTALPGSPDANTLYIVV